MSPVRVLVAAVALAAISGCSRESSDDAAQGGPDNPDSACLERYAKVARSFDGYAVKAAVTLDLSNRETDAQRAFIENGKRTKGFSIVAASGNAAEAEAKFLKDDEFPAIFYGGGKVLGRTVFKANSSDEAVRRACREARNGTGIVQITLGVPESER